jgi:methionine-rich copper-binding protein CopC/putative copper export protein
MRKLTLKNILKATALFFLISIKTVSAHATPVSYFPENQTDNTNLPTEVAITFNENIEPKASSIKVYDEAGSSITIENSQTKPNDSHTLFVKINPVADHSYTVSWQVVSKDDGHFSNGAFNFSTGNKTPIQNAPSFSVNHKSTTPEGLATSLGLLGTAILLGTLTISIFFKNELNKNQSKINRLILFGTICTAVAGFSYIIFKSYYLSTALETKNFLSALTIFSQTQAAKAAIIQIIISLIFLGAFFYKKPTNSKKSTYFLLFLILLLHFIRSYISHALASSFHPYISVFINFIHITFKDLLIGTTIAFLYAFKDSFTAIKNTELQFQILNRLSKISSVAIGIGGLSGSYIVWLHLKNFDNTFTTDWGKHFVILSILAVFLLSFRLFNHLVSIGYEKIKKHTDHFPTILSLEATFGIGVLIVTGFLIITTPPVENPSRFSKTIQSNKTNIIIKEDPSRDQNILITFIDQDKKPFSVQNTITTLEQKTLNTGPITVTNKKIADNQFIIDKQTIKTKGQWQIEITGQNPNQYDINANTTFTYPDDFINPAENKINSFTISIFSVGIISLILGILLFISTKKPPTNTIPVSIYQTGSWSFSLFILGGFFYLFGGFHGGHSLLISSQFEKFCVKNKGTWQENVSIESGKILNSQVTPGCTINKPELFHFTNTDQFNYYIKSQK